MIDEDGQHCSAGALWYGLEDPRNKAVRIEKEMASKEAGEAAAILYAVQNTPREVSIHFKIKSGRILRTLTKDLEKCEDKGWIDIRDSTLLKAIAAALRGKGTRCTLQEVELATSIPMKEADKLAESGLHDEATSDLRTEIPVAHDLQGVKLRTGTQSSFYKAIKVSKPKPERTKTRIMLDITRYAAADLSGKTPTDSQIWMSIRHPDISRSTRDFMWRCLHQAYKIGSYWRNIPTYEHWATCQHCGVDETMEHALLECNVPGQAILWSLARELWEMKGYQWPEMSYGQIFACGLADVRNAAGKKDAGANRLFRILISETAHQIWHLRCTRVITWGNDPLHFLSEAELHNKWLHRINSRLKIDMLLTDTKKYGNRALNKKEVINTWKGVLDKPLNLSDIGIGQSGFLVGIPPLRPPGRNR
ncbi:ribonuclease H-like protein [Mycena crocata]|nr:ribonuclease H-like protein [Mycena crocata]